MDLSTPLATLLYVVGSILLTKYYTEKGLKDIYRGIIKTLDALRDVGYELQNVGENLPNSDAPDEFVEPDISSRRYGENIIDEGPLDITCGAKDIMKSLENEANRIEKSASKLIFLGILSIIIGLLLNLSSIFMR